MQTMSCILVGDGTLLIQCAEILLREEYEIVAVVSSDQSIKVWTRAHSIRHLPTVSEIGKSDFPDGVEYIFSIVNNTILPRRVLELARRYAINYHDGPLPRYAGSHATSWALMNGEAMHGIAWHLMVDEVDGGDIVAHAPVEIRTSDTAFSLNGRCYEAAIATFEKMAGDLKSGRVRLQQQDLAQRTFHAIAASSKLLTEETGVWFLGCPS